MLRAQHNVISKSLLSECVGWTNEQPEPVVNTGVGTTLLFSRTITSLEVHQHLLCTRRSIPTVSRLEYRLTWALTPGCISILWLPSRCLRARARGGAVTCLRRAEKEAGAESLTLKCRSAWKGAASQSGCTGRDVRFRLAPAGDFHPPAASVPYPPSGTYPLGHEVPPGPIGVCKRKCSVAAPGGIRRGRRWH